MVIKQHKICLMIAGFVLLSFSCRKKTECRKQGFEYINTTSLVWYTPVTDSIPIGSTIILQGSVPKKFIDETSRSSVQNSCSFIEGPIGIGMIYPSYQAAADSFEITAQKGKIIKDTINFSEGALKGFRTIRWDGSLQDSFTIRLTIKALSKGVYAFALKQQGYKDEDCALFKYFLRPGNSNAHLNYWDQYVQYPSQDVQRTTYCFKVY